jgi:hypothetical protein
LIVVLTVVAGTAHAQEHDPFARRAWNLELGGAAAIETWNYNISHEEMAGFYYGLTYGLGKAVLLSAGGTLYHVEQRAPDAYLIGATWGLRGRLFKRPRWSPFWEFRLGVSESDTFVPPGGTRFNYLVLGSVGAIVRVRGRVHILGGLEWIHVSNKSLAGRSRNPDIEAVGPKVGVLVGF